MLIVDLGMSIYAIAWAEGPPSSIIAEVTIEIIEDSSMDGLLDSFEGELEEDPVIPAA